MDSTSTLNPQSLSDNVPPIDSRLHNIVNAINDSEEAQRVLPGLAELLESYAKSPDSFDKIEFVRKLLLVFKESPDQTYEEILGKYEEVERDAVDAFVAGTQTLKQATAGLELGPTLGARHEAQQIADAPEITLPLPIEPDTGDDGGFHIQSNVMKRTVGTDERKLFEVSDSKAAIQQEAPPEPNFSSLNVSVHKDAKFSNWGLNVKNTPKYTFVPRTVAGVVEIVKYAKLHDMSVRVSGYRHSWSPSFSKNGQILISTLGIGLATRLPNITALPGMMPGDPEHDLNKIEWADESRYQVRVGCGVTNEQLRRWCNNNKGNEKPRATLPLNVIMVEITYGGSNAPICHGAGIKQQTLSDLVKKIEYVDVNGVLQTINEHDKEFLSAASGCFGLLGVITHLTLQLEPMSYAILRPVKMDVIRAIPPPPDMDPNDIPRILRKKVTPKERAADQAEFERRALNDYYAEWFWFPYHEKMWINTWERTNDPKDVKAYPGTWGKIVQFMETILMQVLQNTRAYRILGDWFPLRITTIISEMAMNSLPDVSDGVLKTYLPDALHFRRCIQNVRVRDVEVEMPLEPSQDPAKKIDFTNVQRAWWDAIILTFENSKKAPMRMPLEMRIMADSNVVMAPQRGNTYGTCSIEVLTLQANAEEFGWNAFAQKIIDKWMSYRDVNGKLLKTRPHWAKEWYDFKVNGKPWLNKLKNEDYKEEIKEFKEILGKIGERDNWTLKDIQGRFSNDMYDELIFN